MSYVESLDDTAWPVLYARFRGVATIEGYDEYAVWLEGQVKRALAEKTKIATINDAAEGIQVSSEVRRHIADWLEHNNNAGAAAATAASFVVINSSIMRGVMTALSWVAKDKMGGVVSVATVEDAWNGAVSALKAEGIAVPPRPRWLAEPRRGQAG